MTGSRFKTQDKKNDTLIYRLLLRSRDIINGEAKKGFEIRPRHKISGGGLIGVLIFLLCWLASGCQTESKEPQLRVINDGTVTIKNLTVIFPEDQIQFGDIAPGEITDYLLVPHGVYRYAAYKFEIDGKLMTQPVIDWVGETPLEGTWFTYTINFDPSRSDWQIIQLVEVTKDK